MKVAIYQPRYFPQLHYYNRVLQSDIFVILDNAQYTKALVHISEKGKERHKSFQSDTVVKLAVGTKYLTVPVKHKGLQPICETELDYSSNWSVSHVGTIASAYGKSTNFAKVFPEIKKLLQKKYKTLGDLDISSFLFGMSQILELKLETDEYVVDKINVALKNSPFRLKKIILGSELGVPRPEGNQKGTEWTVAICKKLGAKEYVHGGTAKAGYMNEEYYSKNGINLIKQEWKCKQYPQQFNNKVGFLPNLSILDLIFNVDNQQAVEILK